MGVDMKQTILLRTLLLSVTTLGLFSCSGNDENIHSSSATTNKQETKISQTTQKTQTQQQQGLMAYADPKTGELREPTAEEKQILRFQEKQLKATVGSAPLEETVLPDGTVMVDLKGQYQHQINVEVIPNCKQANKNPACSQQADKH